MTARSDLARKLGEHVAELRHRRKRNSQEELADDAGVSKKTVSQLERGVSVPPIEKLANIAAALGVTLSALFDFVEPTGERRHDATVHISYMLRGRRAPDIEAVRDIVRLIFDIKRRERPAPRPRKNPQP